MSLRFEQTKPTENQIKIYDLHEYKMSKQKVINFVIFEKEKKNVYSNKVELDVSLNLFLCGGNLADWHKGKDRKSSSSM